MAIEDEVMNGIMEKGSSEQALGHFRMIYKNTSNEVSDREIDLIRFNITEKRKNFYAYDHLKNRFKEFSIKGIQQLWLNGEEITDPQAYFMELYSKTSYAQDFSEFDAQLDVVKALWWFACGDNFYQSDEKRILKEFANELIHDFDKKMGKEYFSKLEVSEDEMRSILVNVENWDKKESKLYMKYVAELYKLKVNRYAEQLKTFCVFNL